MVISIELSDQVLIFTEKVCADHEKGIPLLLNNSFGYDSSQWDHGEIKERIKNFKITKDTYDSKKITRELL